MNVRVCVGGLFVLFSVLLMGCGDLSAFTGNGLGPYVIGKAPPSTVDGSVEIRQSVDENGDPVELLTALVNGSEIAVEIYDGKVWRISVLTPGATLPGGMQVGEKVAKVLARYPNAKVEIGPGPSLVVVPENHCGVSYFTDVPSERIPLKGVTIEALRSLAREATITEALIVGCDD